MPFFIYVVWEVVCVVQARNQDFSLGEGGGVRLGSEDTKL